MNPEGNDRNEAVGAKLLSALDDAFAAMHQQLDVEKQFLRKRMEFLLSGMSGLEQDTPVIEAAIFEIRTLLLNPRKSPVNFNVREVHVSDRAMKIVAEVHAAGKNSGGLRNRKEYSVLAILAEAMVNGNDDVRLEQIVTQTGYRESGVRNTISSLNQHFLPRTKYRIVGDYSTGWRLIVET